MKDYGPLGEPDGTDFVDEDLPGVVGSTIPAYPFNAIRDEILAVIVAAALTPGVALTQLRDAILILIRGTVNALTRQMYFTRATLTDGGTINWNLDEQQVAKVTLAGNRTLANPTNKRDGGTYILDVIQDGTGSRTLSYGSDYVWPGGVEPTLSTTAGSRTILTFVSDGTKMRGSSAGAYSS